MFQFLRKLLNRWVPRQPTQTTLNKEDTDLERFFTDSEYARQVFEELISTTPPSRRLLVIHGIGSVGKSTLLIMYHLSCLRHRIAMALVRGEEAHSAIEILDTWASELKSNNILLPTFENILAHYHALESKVKPVR